MTRKVMLSVAVTITTKEENVHVSAMEEVLASHTKFCLLDNPDAWVYTIKDVDVVINGSEETDQTL